MGRQAMQCGGVRGVVCTQMELHTKGIRRSEYVDMATQCSYVHL